MNLKKDLPPDEISSLNTLADSYDVVVAGGGIGGCGAAVQAARMGASVLMIEETDWIGGQTTAAGVTSQDCATPLPLHSGLYAEFIRRTNDHYERLGVSPRTAYFGRWPAFEPRIGMAILHELIKEANVHSRLDVFTGGTIASVLKEGNTITGVTLRASDLETTITCRVLIDATEWGDVIPLTGARYRVGNCLSEQIDKNRELQGLNWTAVIRKYPSGVPSRLLMNVPPPGFQQTDYAFRGDDAVQIPPYLASNDPWKFGTFIAYRAMPDSANPRKDPPEAFVPADPRDLDTWRERFAMHPVTRTHMNRGHAEAVHVGDVEDPASRLRMLRNAQLKTLRLLYFVQQVLGKTDWSVADDEGYDTPRRRAEVDSWIADDPEIAPFREILYHFPPQPYVRESRRIIGLHTLTAKEIERRPGAPVRFEDVVAIGDYMMDLHQRVTPSVLEADLDSQNDVPAHNGDRGYGPFAIPFRCLIPEQVDGLLAAEKNISQSRLANGATRVQPSAMLTGQAAGAIAALCIRHGVPPRILAPVLVQWELLSSGCPLCIAPLRDLATDSPEWKSAQLAAACGFMELDNGWFRPCAPLETAALSQIAEKLSVAPPESGVAITRQTLATVLGLAAKHSRVTLDYRLADGFGDEPVTRSETAQVLADLLVARGLALVTGEEQVIRWIEPRPVTPPLCSQDLSIALLPPSERWWMESHSDFRHWFDL